MLSKYSRQLADHSGLRRKFPTGVSPEAAFVEDWSLREAAQEAVEALSKIRPDLVAEPLFLDKPLCGSFGCVYRGPDGSIIKIEHGNNEALLASLLLSHPELGDLSILPEFYCVVPTGVVHPFSGLEMIALHREDLENLTGSLPDPEILTLSLIGSSLDYLSKSSHQSPAADLLEIFNHSVARIESNPKLPETILSVLANLRFLIRNGIILCDLDRAANWGLRPLTGEIVARDIGCATFSQEWFLES